MADRGHGLAERHARPGGGAAHGRRKPRARSPAGPSTGGGAPGGAGSQGDLRGASGKPPIYEHYVLARECLFLSRVHGELRTALPPGGLSAGVGPLGGYGGTRSGDCRASGAARPAPLPDARGPGATLVRRGGRLLHTRLLCTPPARRGGGAVAALPVRRALRVPFRGDPADARRDDGPPLLGTTLRQTHGAPVLPPRSRYRRRSPRRGHTARRFGELRPSPPHGYRPAPPNDTNHPRRRAQEPPQSYIKMSSGSKALTS